MMNNRSQNKDVETIERVADTKGVPIDDIEVVHSTTDDGDSVTLFRVYSPDGPKVQITKIQDMETTQMLFRDEIQRKLSALKRSLASENSDTEPTAESEPEPNGEANAKTTAGTKDTVDETTTSTETDTATDRTASTPGNHLDERLESLQDDIDVIDKRLTELESKADALENLEQIFEDS